ncbi:MAG: hypothetical protein ACR2QW_09080 [bacterium]
MSTRFDHRRRYIDGWHRMDGEMLLSATSRDFIFDDPAEHTPVTQQELIGYMHRWERRTRALGSTNRWNLENEVRIDENGILTDWEWWELVGTDLCGMAFVKTSDAGVLVEKITYFDRKHRHANR